MRKKGNLSDDEEEEGECRDSIEKQKYKNKVKNKGVILKKTIFFGPSKTNLNQNRTLDFGTPLKKKSFSLMSVVAREAHDVPTEGDIKDHDLDAKEINNEIEEKSTATTTTTIIQSHNNAKPKTLLTKVVSPSEQSVNPTKTKNVNGANAHHTSYSTHIIPSLSSKVLRF